MLVTLRLTKFSIPLLTIKPAQYPHIFCTSDNSSSLTYVDWIFSFFTGAFDAVYDRPVDAERFIENLLLGRIKMVGEFNSNLAVVNDYYYKFNAAALKSDWINNKKNSQ